MFDLVPWKPLPLPLSDHLQVSGWVSVRRRVLLQSPSYGLTQLTFQRKELSFHPCVCQTRPQPIPPRVCWEVGKDQCHGSDLSIALNALHFAIPPSKRAASGSAADGWHKKKKSIATNPSFQQRRKMTFGAPSVHCSLENMRTCDMCSSRLERYGFTLYLYTHRSWPHWQVQCTLIFQCFWHVLEQFK